MFKKLFKNVSDEFHKLIITSKNYFSIRLFYGRYEKKLLSKRSAIKTVILKQLFLTGVSWSLSLIMVKHYTDTLNLHDSLIPFKLQTHIRYLIYYLTIVKKKNYASRL